MSKGKFDRENVRDCDLTPFPLKGSITYMQVQYYQFDELNGQGTDRKLRIECWNQPNVIKSATGNQCFTRWTQLRDKDRFIKLIKGHKKHKNITQAYYDKLYLAATSMAPHLYFGQIYAKPAAGPFVYFEDQFVVMDCSGAFPVGWLYANDQLTQIKRFSAFHANARIGLRATTVVIDTAKGIADDDEEEEAEP